MAMSRLAARLGNRQLEYPCLHVAGTKGKGSTAALCASALRSAGYRVGLYTSPHLLDYVERFQINGTPITHEEFVDILESLKPVFEAARDEETLGTEAGEQRTRPNAFEIATALAFVLFARRGVDVAVFEVGLGGRLDATNVVVPRVSVVTPVSFDHTNILGNTLDLIAAEKAGIIKANVPVVVSPQQPEALSVIEATAQASASSLSLVGRDVLVHVIDHSLQGQDVVLTDAAGRAVFRFSLPLLGQHQAENAAAAYLALTQSGLALTDKQIRTGFSAVRWPGRFQVESLPDGSCTFVFDSAHNADSFVRLAAALETYFPSRRICLIFGASKERDPLELLRPLQHLVTHVIAASSGHPFALAAEELAERIASLDVKSTVACNIAEALEMAIDIGRSEQRLIVTAGTMYLTAKALAHWATIAPPPPSQAPPTRTPSPPIKLEGYLCLPPWEDEDSD